MKKFLKLSILVLAFLAGNSCNIFAEKNFKFKRKDLFKKKITLQEYIENKRKRTKESLNKMQEKLLNQLIEFRRIGCLLRWFEKLKNGKTATFEICNKKILNNEKELEELKVIIDNAFEYYDPGFDRREFVESIEEKKEKEMFFITARINGKIAGFTHIIMEDGYPYTEDGYPYIEWLAVDPNKQELGLGRKLLFAILKKYPLTPKIRLHSTSESEDFYFHLGFKKIGYYELEYINPSFKN